MEGSEQDWKDKSSDTVVVKHSFGCTCRAASYSVNIKCHQSEVKRDRKKENELIDYKMLTISVISSSCSVQGLLQPKPALR